MVSLGHHNNYILSFVRSYCTYHYLLSLSLDRAMATHRARHRWKRLETCVPSAMTRITSRQFYVVSTYFARRVCCSGLIGNAPVPSAVHKWQMTQPGETVPLHTSSSFSEKRKAERSDCMWCTEKSVDKKERKGLCKRTGINHMESKRRKRACARP